MDAGDGKRERDQGKEDFVSNTMLDICDPSTTDDEQTVTPPMNSPKRTKKLKIERDTQLMHGRIRSKTRISKSPNTT
jgi:hypothetical protein